MKVTNQTTIVIVNGALRLLDNPLLVDIDGPTVFVFALTPYYFSKAHYTDIPNVGENRFKYLFACLTKFREQLKEKHNADLLVLEGTYKQVVDQTLEEGKFTDRVEVRVLHQPYQYEIMYQQELVEEANNAYNISIIKKGMTLLPRNILYQTYKRGMTFKEFHFSCLRQQQQIAWTDVSNIKVVPVPLNLESIDGEADCFNFFYDLKGVENFDENRKLISGGSTTKLEAALSLGTISKIMAYGVCLNNQKATDTDKGAFIRNLIWNDYCWIISEVEGNKIFSKNGLSKDLNNGKVKALPDFINGTGTDVKFYNLAMGKLRTNGFIPNRVRMILGYYVIKVLDYSHLALAEYFEHYLLGFNVHNNWLGAQSCNGTGLDTIVGGRPFNIKNQLTQYDLNGEYL